jgi:hypothetical protein
LGWLRAGVASGRVPSTRRPNALEAATDRLRLSLLEVDRRVGGACPPLRAPTQLELADGESIGIGGRVVVVLLDRGRAASTPVGYGVGMLNPELAHTLRAVAPVSIRLAPGRRVGPLGATLCAPRR